MKHDADLERAELIGVARGVIAQSMRGTDKDVWRAINTLNRLIREDERAKWGVGEFHVVHKGIAA